MDPPGHGGSGWRLRQAWCQGGSPGVNTTSATGWERHQSLFVLGLLRLGERLPALAWGMARGGGRAIGKGAQERGRVLGREHTQELLSVSVAHAQWHQERPLLLAVHMPRARKHLLGTPRRN